MLNRNDSGISNAYEIEATHIRRRTLLILYIAYGFFYLPRKADSVTKSALIDHAGFSMEDLALSDTVYLSVYTVSLLGSGVLGARIPSNQLLAGAMWCIALVSVLKGFATSPTQYIFLQIIHAACQSIGWPTCIKLLAKWITGDRGMIMGFWTTCQSLGGVVGAISATYAMSHWSWRWSYFYLAPLLVGWGVVCLMFISEEPIPFPTAASSVELIDRNGKANKIPTTTDDVDLEQGGGAVIHRTARASHDSSVSRSPASSSSSSSSSPPVPVPVPSLSAVLALPGVVLVCFAYFFLKFLRYALLFWLPFYYHEGLGYDVSVSGYMSTSFEFGGMVGTPFIGWLSDRYLYGRRDVTAAIFMAAASGMLALCNMTSGSGVVINSTSMFLVGILVIGPDSVLSGTIAQDIGNNSPMGSAAVGTLAGLINSVGSCGSIFQSYATTYITKAYGWSTLFSIFVLCAVICSTVLFKASFNKKEDQLSGRIKTLLKTFLQSPASLFSRRVMSV